LILLRSDKGIFCGLVMALALTGPAMAQAVTSTAPLTEEANLLHLEALGQRLALPVPDWLPEADQSSGAVVPLVETIYRADERQAVLQILPKGETEALWNTHYGVILTAGAEQPLTEVRDAVVSNYARSCQPARTAFFQLGEDGGDALAPLGFVCGAYRNSLTGLSGKGEVMVMSFKRSDTGTALVFQEWRGPAFDPSTPTSWPVPTDLVEGRARQFQTEAALTPVD